MSEPDQREEAIFEVTLQMPADRRGAYLDKTCADDPELRRRVEVLLGAFERAGSFLKAPAVSAPMPVLTEKPGDRIDRYKLLEEIGEGGCGVVYVAEQEEPVHRRVALKVIKLGMDTKQVIARFDAERQALAMMDHPNIAKVLDASATETGRPYFVMELVRGIKITDYCDQNQLTLHERLALFIQVCRATQHAHQKGIIHRDIKPSNILVTLHDGVPVPKVIDFGIAKATQGRLTDQTVYTAFEQFIGTPAYMSPEQAEMSGLDIDTRSDIYSLGVLLYELLTGTTPFDAKELLAAGLDEMRRTIREVEPVKPSTRLTQERLANHPPDSGKSGIRNPQSAIDKDLDWIVMKCLEKDRSRRYETANGLAMDLQRHLANEPVLARPPSKRYRIQKLVHRHRVAFGAMSAIAVALASGVTLSIWQAMRATHAQQQAQAINRFLREHLLNQATPDQNDRERKVTMEEVLNHAARNLDEDLQFATQPELEATLRLDVGSTYHRLGLVEEAERHLRRAVALRQASLGMRHRDTLAAQHELADLLETGLRKYEVAESLARETWLGRQQLLGAEHPDTINSLSVYAQVLADLKKLAEAERFQRQVGQLYERVLGADHLTTINSLGDLAYLLATRGDFAHAEEVEREELKRFQRTGLADKEGAMYAVNNLAMYRLLQGDPFEAERLLLEVRPRAIRIFGSENLVTLHIQHVLARALAEAGKLPEAEALAGETLAVRRRVTPGHESTGRTLLVLGSVLVRQDRMSEAEPLLEEALAIFRQRYAMKPELAAQAANWLGTIQTSRQAYLAAEALLLPTIEPILAPTAAMSLHEQRMAVGHVLALYQAWNRPELAAAWQQKLDEVGKGRPSIR